MMQKMVDKSLGNTCQIRLSVILIQITIQRKKYIFLYQYFKLLGEVHIDCEGC